MTDTTMSREMMIPKSRGETISYLVMTAIVVVFSILSVSDLLAGVGIIASCLWLVFVGLITWDGVRKSGSLSAFLVGCLGGIVGPRFIYITTTETKADEIQLGFDFLGRRFVQEAIPFYKIKSVERGLGQASGLAGRDMNDWHVYLWFDLGDLWMIGPTLPKEKAESLLVSFVEFLNGSGANLVRLSEQNTYLRETVS